MKKLLITVLILFSSLSTVYAYDMNSAIGYWINVNDYTDQSTLLVKITQQNGTFYGNVVKIFPGDGRTNKDVCAKCEGATKNKPIMGMTVLWGFTQTPNGLSTGYVLDPYTGKINERTMTLIEGGRQLQFHNLWRLSRHTQTWVRVN